MDDPIIASVQEALGVRFDPRLSSTIFRGHVAGVVGLDLARQLLRNSPRSACIVSGVDSNINAATLRWLEASGRLKLDENSNGLVPGEGAAAVLVRAAPSGDSVLEVAGLGFAMESAGVTSVEPFLGHGLAEAARSALREADEPLSRMDFRLSDATGETYGFKEQSLTLSRVLRGGPSAMPLWHCADAVGDVGAASGVFQLVRAFEAFRKGYAPGSRAIGFTSNVKGERAAVVLRWRGAGLPH